MNYTDLWPLIQKDVLGALAADEFVGLRKGVAVEPGDVESTLTAKVNAALGPGLDGKQGVGFLVLPIERADDENGSNPGGPLRLTLTVQFVENVVINNGPRGTGVPIRIYASRAEKVLKLYTPVGLTQNLIPKNPVISEFTPERDANLRIGQVEFTAREADSVPLHRLNRPQLSTVGAGYPYSVTVDQPQAESIYYTLDGSHPYSGNPQATLYSGPVAIPEPLLFRARAFAAGYLGSDTAATYFG